MMARLEIEEGRTYLLHPISFCYRAENLGTRKNIPLHNPMDSKQSHSVGWTQFHRAHALHRQTNSIIQYAFAAGVVHFRVGTKACPPYTAHALHTQRNHSIPICRRCWSFPRGQKSVSTLHGSGPSLFFLWKKRGNVRSH